MDRCPCGTGTSATMATLHAKGELPLGVEFTTVSIIGTQFHGKLIREIQGKRSIIWGKSLIDKPQTT
ncbi:hypothetical protein F7734_14890 [Scytonema sp. UIC 10036]|uniref:proline racemase family protein n=1 Tax=Scytonema sp. UIC 10036 TaxID=2304196 RepID=UPI0012DAE289|nr:proline racemase family protein [Scytonema sp. UIC 10036]MUG93636.1 hypothetical protein [Scytonema sp. UIC 10036]